MDDYCYECTGYGDDCPYNDSNWEGGWWRDDI